MVISRALQLFYLAMVGVNSPGTVRFYVNRLPSLIAYFGEIDISTIQLDDLRAWRASLACKKTRWGGCSTTPIQPGGYSVWTLHQYIRAGKRLFKWLVEEGWLVDNPARRLELPKLPKPVRRGISSCDRDYILAAAYRSGARDYAICRMLADTACRVGGLAGMQVRDLELETCRAVVHEKGRGGLAKARWVFFGLETARALDAWLAVRPQVESNSLFLSKTNQQLTTWGIRALLKRLARSVGVMDGENPHNWRHAAIRGMLKNGMSLSAASQIAGHSSVVVTGDLYGTFCEDELAQLHSRYSWMENHQMNNLGETYHPKSVYATAAKIVMPVNLM